MKKTVQRAQPFRWHSALAAIVVLGLSTATHAALINEYSPNPEGDEDATSFIEIIGMPGDSLDGLYIVTIEGDGTAAGALNNVVDLTGLSFDGTGLATVTGTAANLENPSHTLVLTRGFTGNPGSDPGANDGDDLDVDNDGIIDPDAPMVFGEVLDALGVADVATDFLYAAQLGGVDMTFVPELDPLPSDEPQVVFRELNSGDFYQASNDFSLIADAAGTLVNGSLFTPQGPTPAAPNPALVPEPSSAAFGLLALLACAGYRRRS